MRHASIPFVLVACLIALIYEPVVKAQSIPLSKSASQDLDERVNIPVELQTPIDFRTTAVGDKIILKVMRDTRLSRATTIPKGAKLSATVTLVHAGAHCPDDVPQTALLVNEANWKGRNLPLNGYLWGPIMSEDVLTFLSSDRPKSDAKIGWTGFDPKLGSIIHFSCGEMVGYGGCFETPGFIRSDDSTRSVRQTRAPTVKPTVCDRERLGSGSTLEIRHLPSRFQLNLLFDDGAYAAARVVEMDAENGSTDSAFELAQRLHNGNLFVKADAQAVHWLTVAAEQGHLAAQTNLAVFYAQGLGMSAANLVTAYKWFAVSAERGVEQNKSAIRKLEQMLTPEQLAEGKRLSSEWLEAHPKSQ